MRADLVEVPEICTAFDCQVGGTAPAGLNYELCFMLPHLAQVHHSLSMKFPQV